MSRTFSIGICPYCEGLTQKEAKLKLDMCVLCVPCTTLPLFLCSSVISVVVYVYATVYLFK